MRVHIPNSAFLGNIDGFLQSIDTSEEGALDISSNPRWISIHPVVLCMIAALGKKAKPGRIHFKELTAKSSHYLERMGLFSVLDISSDFRIQTHEPSGRFIPLTIISHSSQISPFITEVIPLLHLSPSQAEPLRYIISELVRNVIEHAQSDEGAIVAAQYYKKSNTIRLGIADNGVGIKNTITRSHQADNDLAAIRLALTPGITGTTNREGGSEQNAGAGLFFIKSIAVVNENFFFVYSGDSMYKLLKAKRKALHSDPFLDRHSKRDSLPYWKGTVVGIDISLDATQEFSELLDLMREAYIKTIRERKKARLRRPRFI